MKKHYALKLFYPLLLSSFIAVLANNSYAQNDFLQNVDRICINVSVDPIFSAIAPTVPPILLSNTELSLRNAKITIAKGNCAILRVVVETKSGIDCGEESYGVFYYEVSLLDEVKHTRSNRVLVNSIWEKHKSSLLDSSRVAEIKDEVNKLVTDFTIEYLVVKGKALTKKSSKQ